jgi:hypothetical protein
MAEEFAALSIIPEGLGPSPVFLEPAQDNPLKSPYMVTGFVSGHERKLSGWNDRVLATHARQMARLHTQVFDACGNITAPEEDRLPRLSLADSFASSLAWWREAHPDVAGARSGPGCAAGCGRSRRRGLPPWSSRSGPAGDQSGVGGEYGQQDLALIGLGLGQGEGHRQAI